MSSTIPFYAYKGTEPYLFVSYAHKDRDGAPVRVAPDTPMHTRGGIRKGGTGATPSGRKGGTGATRAECTR